MLNATEPRYPGVCQQGNRSSRQCRDTVTRHSILVVHRWLPMMERDEKQDGGWYTVPSIVYRIHHVIKSLAHAAC